MELKEKEALSFSRVVSWSSKWKMMNLKLKSKEKILAKRDDP